jgi:hypothetical protein
VHADLQFPRPAEKERLPDEDEDADAPSLQVSDAPTQRTIAASLSSAAAGGPTVPAQSLSTDFWASQAATKRRGARSEEARGARPSHARGSLEEPPRLTTLPPACARPLSTTHLNAARIPKQEG